MDRDRRKRINSIKITIVIFMWLIIGALAAGCIVLGLKNAALRGELKEARRTIESQEKALYLVREPEGADGEQSITDYEELLATGQSVFDQRRLMEEDNNSPTDGSVDPYCIYLTFDDGPSENTYKILTILREYGVKATFFVQGKTDEDSLMLYDQIVQAGHTLGMHSFSHRYSQIYSSGEAFEKDLDDIFDLLFESTGTAPVYYRFPGGTSNSVTSDANMRKYIDILHGKGIEYIDWNIDSRDATAGGIGADEIVDNVFKNFGRYHHNVVLMHDGTGHDSTVEALPMIIERARNMGAELLPITEETVPVQHLKTR